MVVLAKAQLAAYSMRGTSGLLNVMTCYDILQNYPVSFSSA